MAAHLKEQIEPHFLPRERTPGALAPTLRELDRALDLVSELLKKYYWVVCDGYLDLRGEIQWRSAGGFSVRVDQVAADRVQRAN